MIRLWLIGGLVGCTGAGGDTEPVAVIDLRAEYPMPAKGGLQILTPDLHVEPYSEALNCFYGQWDGPEMGVVSYTPLHPNEFHHHSLVPAHLRVNRRWGWDSLSRRI